MKVDGRHFRSIWLEDDGWSVGAIDQRRLPHEFVVARIANAADATDAIRSMLVRGAPLIGATAAYGMALAMRTEASDAALDRAYVNNGGDIALHLDNCEQFTVGLMDRPDRRGLMRTITIEADDAIRGVATSGRHGRSFSLGIADAVTVLARNASQADAAATIIANTVDLPGHPAIVRMPAKELQPDSDLGARLVTRDVGELAEHEVADALEAGACRARQLLAAGLIEGAALRLLGETVVVGASGTATQGSQAIHSEALRNLLHA